MTARELLAAAWTVAQLALMAAATVWLLSGNGPAPRTPHNCVAAGVAIHRLPCG